MKYFLDLNDKRNQVVKNLLEKDGEQVFEFDFKTIKNISKNDMCVFSPAKKFSTEELKSLPSKIKLVCGKLSDEQVKILKQKKIQHINLMSDEIFTVKNANLTSEAVLSIIIEKTKVSIFESAVLILGGGRIAKALAVMLKGLGVQFAIVSYNPIKFPSYFSFSDKCYYRENFVRDLEKYNVIVNTIPAKIIGEDIVEKIKKETVFIETASVKCLEENEKLQFEYLFSPALPQKYASQSAGKYVYESIKGKNNYEKN